MFGILEVYRRLKAWARGEHRCIYCGRTWYAYPCFGNADFICPECYPDHPHNPWRFPRSILTGRLKAEPR